MKTKTLLLLALLLSACGSIDPTPPDEKTPDDTTPDEETLSKVVISTEGSQTKIAVDAHDEQVWVYFDLDTKTEVKESGAWDLAFQRFLVRSKVSAARLDGSDFESLSTAPAEGYLVDAEDGDDEGTDPDLAFLYPTPWYDYNILNHRLDPADALYVVRSSEGAFFKVQMLGYYDVAGSSGHPSLRFASVAAPEPEEEEPLPEGVITIDASSNEAWAYVRIAQGKPVAGTDAAWDIALKRTTFKTNGGVSGSGVAGVKLAPSEVAYADIDSSTTFGFVSDSVLSVAGPGGSTDVETNSVLVDWYDYNGQTHQLTPKDRNYLVRTSEGEYAKLRIESYASGTYTLRVEGIEREVETRDIDLVSSTNNVWVALNLRSGETVEVDTLEESLEWDLAFSRTSVRTNSGTSGIGNVGVYDAQASFDELSEAPTEAEYVIDELIVPAYPPGAAGVTNNAVLSTWYDYDSATHVITPRATTFVIRTVDGGYAKLAFTSWTSATGTLGLRFAFSGPLSSSF